MSYHNVIAVLMHVQAEFGHTAHAGQPIAIASERTSDLQKTMRIKWSYNSVHLFAPRHVDVLIMQRSTRLPEI